jgi:hypothetical protein
MPNDDGEGSSDQFVKHNEMQYTKLYRNGVVSVHDKLPDIIWTRYFVQCQGYDISEYIAFQDNKSSLL